MNIYTLLALVLIGLLTGALGGMIGIGGGILIIPALIFIIGLNQHEATGTSLAVLLPPIGLFAAYNYYRAGYVNIKYALILAITFMIGSYFSSKISINLPDNVIKKVFGVVLFLVAIKMFFSK